MDFIPMFHFITALVIFGLLFYVYNPVVNYLFEIFPSTGPYVEIMFFLWGSLAVINLIVSGIRLVMKMQQQRIG